MRPSRAPTYDPTITTRVLNATEYADLLRSPRLDDELAAADPLRLILLDGVGPSDVLPHPGSLPFVVGALARRSAAEGPDAVDLVVDGGDADVVATQVAAHPIAATTLAVLLRASTGVPVDTALALESSAYSMLQGGKEFAAWRGDVEAAPVDSDGPTVEVDRHDDGLHIALNRPDRHNAITARLRDELCAALAVALADDSIRRVRLTGHGPSFCSGGDLAEFGARADPSAAHLTRLTRSPARLIHRLAARTHAHIHGHTLGGGIEMAAFAGRVTAAPDTRIALPEVGLGLIPGAGGTVSLPQRIGRQRTAWLALTGCPISAETALEWGLVDEIGAALAGDRRHT